VIACGGDGSTTTTSSCDGDASTPSEAGVPLNEAGQPLSCDSSKDPKDSAGCVDDALGVFVDGSGGDDANPGTKAKPLKTIGKAVASAEAAKKSRVFVCEGLYGENLTIKTALGLYGGWKCGSWTYNGTKPMVDPTRGVALTLDGANGAVVEDLEIDGSADPATHGDSAIAVFASQLTRRFGESLSELPTARVARRARREPASRTTTVRSPPTGSPCKPRSAVRQRRVRASTGPLRPPVAREHRMPATVPQSQRSAPSTPG
jgi:hypothetical protein